MESPLSSETLIVSILCITVWAAHMLIFNMEIGEGFGFFYYFIFCKNQN